MPLTARLLCARIVRQSPSFFAREMVRPRDARIYTLRRSGLRVAIRHAANDSATLAEIFYRGDYIPPPEVRAAIGACERVLDLGANIGLFGVFAASQWPSAAIVGYEADPGNYEVLRRTIELNGLASRWSAVCAAAGAHDGEVELAAGRAMESFVLAEGATPSIPTIRVPMCDVLAQASAADLVKIDIEGGEWEILLDSRFKQQPPRALVFEYHPHMCPGADARVAAEQALRAARLSSAPIWHKDDGYGMLWAWRE